MFTHHRLTPRSKGFVDVDIMENALGCLMSKWMDTLLLEVVVLRNNCIVEYACTRGRRGVM